MKSLLTVLLLFIAVSVMAGPLSWQTTSSLPKGIKDAACVVGGDYVYMLGGRTTDAPYAASHCYYAAINTDGTLGTWTATTDLPGERASMNAYVYDGNIYLWGGWRDGYPTENTCFYAPINGDGSLGSWVTSSVTIPDGAGEVQMDSYGRGITGFGKYLYIIGGERNDASYSRDCYYSEIQPDGDYGAWTTTTQLPDPENGDGYWFHGVAIYDGDEADYIYMVGGNHGGTSEDHIIYNTINSDGSLGAEWQTSPIPLNQGCYENGCAIIDRYIFSVGGLNGSTPLDNVQMIEIDPSTGAVESVTDQTVLPEARARTHAVSYAKDGKLYLYNIGGAVYSGDPYYDTCWVSEYATPTPTPVVLDAAEWEKYE